VIVVTLCDGKNLHIYFEDSRYDWKYGAASLAEGWYRKGWSITSARKEEIQYRYETIMKESYKASH